ncbi:hypothetical protein KU75_24945 [Pectobacterium odoriferum]|uniref:Uncharacterized protein n=1 Tax=Pectobacterium odoriferum TaxID=78398 RepID=A0ABR4VI68_9GAMM|nr:hypothetical protein KU75_24945 [Pectobacterium odoriferum]
MIVEYVQTTAGKNIMPMGILSLKYSFKISFLYYLLILKYEVNGEWQRLKRRWFLHVFEKK